VPWTKVAYKFDLLLYFSKKLLNENNRPIGENSPNPITLMRSIKVTRPGYLGRYGGAQAEILCNLDFRVLAFSNANF
jgi:hypothetical protein